MIDDLTRLRENAKSFQQRIHEIKRGLPALDFEWYPFDTLSAFIHLDHFLTGDNRRLFSGKKKILDVGCQDGEMSFCLETEGHDVTALDHPTYSHNCMRGIRTLKEALRSEIRLCEVDLDRQFTLGAESYDIAVMLGVLYHLRNPFYVLEELAARAAYCVLSTRIARRFPDGSAIPSHLPIAYLLADRELNDDETNYFIFSELGLRTLFERTHWDVCEIMTAGATGASDPIRSDRDERLYCLLKSRYGRLPDVEMIEGWHEPEGAGWRWTKREFRARVRCEANRKSRSIVLNLFVPDALISRYKKLNLSIDLNGTPFTREVYDTWGSKVLVRRLPRTASPEYLITGTLSHALPPDDMDSRERGIIVNSICIR